ncbi:MAG: SpaA isopeptide-forming pilin-related protein [Candidatus Choladocola sp.]|nr:SpaA isopeptide-forming pilin-related protein [Candidatus Choladocola sp.]
MKILKKMKRISAFCFACALLFLCAANAYGTTQETLMEEPCNTADHSAEPDELTEADNGKDAENPMQTEEPEQTDHPGQTEEPEQTDHPEQTEEPEQTDNSEQAEEPVKKEDPAGTAGKTEGQDITETETETETMDVADTGAETYLPEILESSTEMELQSGNGLRAEAESETEAEPETDRESETETETESETETDMSKWLDENWQDGPVMRAGMRTRALSNTVIHRDNSGLLSYLGFPCYFKYVTGHGMDTGGKTVVAYCLYNTREAPDTVDYEPDGTKSFSKEITYCMYNGCRYQGKTAYNAAYSTGNWKKDYYITQVAVHIINHRQGREGSIEDELDKSKDPTVYKLVYKMVEDAYADSQTVSSVTNQTQEVTFTVSPAAQKDWIRQSDGTWRTSSDYVCSAAPKSRVVAVKRTVGSGTPSGVSLKVKDSNDPLSPFWFTATEDGYRRMVQNKITVSATLSVTSQEYGGWWYRPVDGSNKRQHITFLELDAALSEQKPQVTATAEGIYFSVRIRKQDAESGTNLQGAVYGLYKDESCSVSAARFPATDVNGESVLSDLSGDQDIYYVREITAPAGYCRDTTVYPVNCRQQQDILLNLKDSPQKVGLILYKEGEMLTGVRRNDTGVVFQYTVQRLRGAEFDLYAAETIKNSRGETVYGKNALVRSRLITGTDGTDRVEGLWPGKYFLAEKKAPSGMVLSTGKTEVTLQPENEITSVTMTELTEKNVRQKASVTVNKSDSETGNPLQGAVYGLYNVDEIRSSAGETLVSPETLLSTAVTDRNGNAVFDADLPIGYSYRIVERKAPEGYVRDQEFSFAFTFREDAAQEVQKFFCSAVNKRTEATLVLQKTDRETQETVPQGDASLAGARYGLYAREDIIHPDGATGVVYRKDQQVAVLETDEQGKSSAGRLFTGRYYLKELVPPTGYVKDETEYEVDLLYESDENLTVEKEAVVSDQVKKQGFQLIKRSDIGTDVLPALQGAGFTAWRVSQLEKSETGEYLTEKVSPVILGKTGETELFTDENGYLCTVPLPYGTYLVRETTVPEEHSPVKDFFVTVSEHSPDNPQPWMVLLDKSFMAKLKIVKKDSVTGRTVLVPGAEFRIKNLETGAYVKQTTSYPENRLHESFFTDKTGCLVLPSPLTPGTYQVEEITAPEGYVLNGEPVKIVLTSQSAWQVDPVDGTAIACLEYFDQPVNGRIEIIKTGEKPERFDGDFHYSEYPLSGVVFDIVAEEHIVSPDGSSGILYEKGTIAASVMTDENGRALAETLPLGTYRILERQLPEGYVKGEKDAVVKLEYQDQDTPVVTETVRISNRRQQVTAEVKKTDRTTGKMLSGAEFGLYAKDDMKNTAGEVIVPADTQIDTCITDQNGNGSFQSDLPHGFYYVKELSAPAGYVKSTVIQDVDLRAGKESGSICRETLLFENEPIQVEISKTDIVNGLEIPGARLSVRTESGETVETWISGNEPHMIRALPAGKYVLEEITAPYGYCIAEQAEFEVEETGEIQQVIMEDERVLGRLTVKKTDEKTGLPLEGAVFELRSEEGEILETLVTDENGEAQSGLYEIGTYAEHGFECELQYILKETAAPEGYEKTDEEYRIVFSDTDKTGTAEMIKEVINRKKETAEGKRSGGPSGVPGTGDSTSVWSAVCVFCASAMTAFFCLLYARKRRLKRR